MHPERPALRLPKRLLIVALLLFLPAARFECRLGTLGTDGIVAVDHLVVTPAQVTLFVGERAVLDGVAGDRFGRRVGVALRWESLDPAVASVSPRVDTRTVVTARSPGETFIAASHGPSSATDTARVSVTERSSP